MNKKRYAALLVLMVLTSLTVGDWSQEGSIEAKAAQSSNVPRPQPAQANSSPTTIWEYKILDGTTLELASLEGETNDYAKQGFVVDSLQAVTNFNGGNGTDGMVRRDSDGHRTYDTLFRISSTSRIIVLMKRAKR